MPERGNDALREAAAHRGLKLVRSRRRKPGMGDYGRYGLTDDDGKPLLGFADGGLTATPEEIRDYLRRSEVSTWAQSAASTPDRLHSEPEATADDAPVVKDAPEAVSTSGGEPPDRRKAVGKKRPKAPMRVANEEVDENPSPRPAPEPKPVMVIRAASKADLDGVSRLLGGEALASELAGRLAELGRVGGGALIADKAGVIGVVAWHAILCLQSAPIGRITLLTVAQDERRQGVGRALVEATLAAMIAQGCATFEAMSDIALHNANGFYRAMDFSQRSYRFVRDA